MDSEISVLREIHTYQKSVPESTQITNTVLYIALFSGMTPAIPQLIEFHLLMEQILYLQTTESESPVTDKQ